MFIPNISTDEIAKLKKISFPGKSIVASTHAQLEEWVPILSNETVLGFDTETKPSFKKGIVNGIALLQLASDSISLLVRVKETGLPDILLNLLENEHILKIGVAIHDDIKGLKRIRSFTPKGFIELQQLAPKFNIEEQGLRKMAAIVLNGKVSKRQQLSNWEAPQLTEAQIEYASTDAWICREIWNKFKAINPSI